MKDKKFYAILDYSHMSTEPNGARVPRRTLLVTNDFKEAKAIFDRLADKRPFDLELSEGHADYEGTSVVWYGLQIGHLREPIHRAFTSKK